MDTLYLTEVHGLHKGLLCVIHSMDFDKCAMSRVHRWCPQASFTALKILSVLPFHPFSLSPQPLATHDFFFLTVYLCLFPECPMLESCSAVAFSDWLLSCPIALVSISSAPLQRSGQGNVLAWFQVSGGSPLVSQHSCGIHQL